MLQNKELVAANLNDGRMLENSLADVEDNDIVIDDDDDISLSTNCLGNLSKQDASSSGMTLPSLIKKPSWQRSFI